MNKYFYNIFIISLLIISIIYIFSKNKEGFSAKDIGKISNEVKNISMMTDKLPQEINNINTTIDKKFEAINNNIEKQTTDILSNKLTSIFSQLKDIFNEGIVIPLKVLFQGIGEMFIQIFNILIIISKKIISLPMCILPYIIIEIGNIFNAIYKAIIPKFLRPFLNFLYTYTFGILFGLIGYLFGWDNIYKTCYGFNISSEINNMNKQFKNISTAFNKDFGNLDFSKIKV